MSREQEDGSAPRLALVLSGGGARGAYEVGVLSYLFDELQAARGRPFAVDIICGTSVGAVNAAHLAAHIADPKDGSRRLVKLWSELKLDSVLGFGLKQAASLTGFFKTDSAQGLVDIGPMAKFIRQQIPWRKITRSMREGHLRALTISCTEVLTGRTVQFTQTGPNTGTPSQPGPRALIRPCRIGPQHVLASASIPLVFPPVRVGKQLYIDGGLRQNTPVSPALRFGATHVLCVGTYLEEQGVVLQDQKDEPTTSYVIGKIMDALLLDHLSNDVAQVRMINDLLQSGIEAFGPDFLHRLNEAAAQRGGRLLQPTNLMMISPSTALGQLGAEYLKNHTVRSRSRLTRKLLEWLDSGSEADLASYLLFEGDFALQLIELGRSDARAARDRLLSFLDEIPESSPPQGGADEMPTFAAPAVG
ncbi:MAG: patatin-like phospholipase family protein [Polyangiaceae bacterium]|nr:patatin-like phospholipase family protein [Polyangiaceae bacterium]